MIASIAKGWAGRKSAWKHHIWWGKEIGFLSIIGERKYHWRAKTGAYEFLKLRESWIVSINAKPTHDQECRPMGAVPRSQRGKCKNMHAILVSQKCQETMQRNKHSVSVGMQQQPTTHILLPMNTSFHPCAYYTTLLLGRQVLGNPLLPNPWGRGEFWSKASIFQCQLWQLPHPTGSFWNETLQSPIRWQSLLCTLLISAGHMTALTVWYEGVTPGSYAQSP